MTNGARYEIHLKAVLPPKATSFRRLLLVGILIDGRNKGPGREAPGLSRELPACLVYMLLIEPADNPGSG